MIKTETHYKIRRSDGLFSDGGHYPSFSEKGKTWKKINHLKSHLTGIPNYPGNKSCYDNCEVVTFRVEIKTENGVTLTLKELGWK